MIALGPLAAALLAVTAPFTAEQPRVREGNERLRAGDPAGALERYDQAERQAGPHPEIDYDRGEALHALGRHPEAREAFRRSLERDQAGTLSSRALQNMGNTLDAMGDRDGAVRAFSQALQRDPGNEDARYNLEVLLRRRSEGKGAPRDQGGQGPRSQPPEPSQAGQGQGHERPRPQPGPRPGQEAEAPRQGPGQAKAPQPGSPPGQAGARPEGRDGKDAGGPAGERRAGAQGESAQARPDGLDRQDAERLLDALRARERQMPLGPAGRREARRKDAERDW